MAAASPGIIMSDILVDLIKHHTLQITTGRKLRKNKLIPVLGDIPRTLVRELSKKN